MHTLYLARLLPVLLLLSACGSAGLMRHGMRCDQDGNTALILASWKGRTELAKLLLDKGADVNAQSTVCGEPCILHALGPKRDRFGGDAEHSGVNGLVAHTHTYA